MYEGGQRGYYAQTTQQKNQEKEASQRNELLVIIQGRMKNPTSLDSFSKSLLSE